MIYRDLTHDSIMPQATNRAWSEFQKASRSLESPPPHPYHLFLIVRLAVKNKRERERNDDECRRAENISAASASRASCVDGRARRTRTTTRTSTNRRPPTEIFSSFYSRLRPFTSPDRFSRGLNTGMHRQRPRYMCAYITYTHAYIHIQRHTHMRSPHILSQKSV